MSDQLDTLRRQAKTLQNQYKAGDANAVTRVRAVLPAGAKDLKRADFLHVVARERGFASWPHMKAATDAQGITRADAIQRLKIALAHGQTGVVQRLLTDTPDLAEGDFALQVALLHDQPVLAALTADPSLGVQDFGPRKPLFHLAFSRAIHIWPDREAAMLSIAQALVDAGADVNARWDNLSVLYGAIGHADNMVLGQWLLDHGADPNDGESLYHATELGHLAGLQMLLSAGADPAGTNALLRAMDFDDTQAIQMLLDHGADPNAFIDTAVNGEAPTVIPCLHHAARRQVSDAMCELLLDAGADPQRTYMGATAYSFAQVYGHAALAQMIADRVPSCSLSPEEMLLARAAQLDVPDGVWLDEAKLPSAYTHLIRELVHLPGKLPHIKALVQLGLFYDKPDDQGLPPVQIAGWEGLPDVMGYFLSLKPDLGHVNGYGGTLLGTIIHGSENAPDVGRRDHVGCLQMVLDEGMALPRSTLKFAGHDGVARLLQDWAAAKPGQVVDG